MIRNIALGVAATLVAAGCTSLENRVGNNSSVDYSKHDERIAIQFSDQLKTPDIKSDYDIPAAKMDGVSGKDLPILSPSLVHPLLKNSYIQDGSKKATINIDKINDETELDAEVWRMVRAYMKAQQYREQSFDANTMILTTDWLPFNDVVNALNQVSQENEQAEGQSDSNEGDILSGLFGIGDDDGSVVQPAEGRFRISFDMKSHKRSGNLSVELVEAKNFESNTKALLQRTVEVSFLNGILQREAKQIRLDSKLRREELQLGVELTLGFDADGESTMISQADYDITWVRLSASLMQLGFNISDFDRSAGSIFAKYSGPESSGFFDAFSSSDEELNIKKQTYHIQLGDLGERTTISFLTDENIPMPATFNTELHPALAELMADNSLKIR